MVVKPSSLATRAMDSAAKPSASATATAVSRIWSRLRPRLGPRVPAPSRSHSNFTDLGRTRTSGVFIRPPVVVLLPILRHPILRHPGNCVAYKQSVVHTQFLKEFP